MHLRVLKFGSLCTRFGTERVREGGGGITGSALIGAVHNECAIWCSIHGLGECTISGRLAGCNLRIRIELDEYIGFRFCHTTCRGGGDGRLEASAADPLRVVKRGFGSYVIRSVGRSFVTAGCD